MICFCIMALVTGVTDVCGRTVVVDASDCTPLPAASVFNADGVMVAMTDADGVFEQGGAVTVRCLGYVPASLSGAADTLRMEPAPYELDELAVRPADRDVMRMVCYVREYMGVGTDSASFAVYADYMVDYMLPLKKLKKFKGRNHPRVLVSRNIKKTVRPGVPDSLEVNSDVSDLSWLQLAAVPAERDGSPRMLPDSLRGRCGTDSTAGKYGLLRAVRVTPERVTIHIDPLADCKDHCMSPWIFKLLGMTIDFNVLCMHDAYKPNPRGELRPEDLIMSTLTMEATGRGKWIKKAFGSKDPVRMRSYFEVYPVELTYHDVEEARALEKEVPATDGFTVPDHAMQLDAATLDMIEKSRTIKPSKTL